MYVVYETKSHFHVLLFLGFVFCCVWFTIEWGELGNVVCLTNTLPLLLLCVLVWFDGGWRDREEGEEGKSMNTC